MTAHFRRLVAIVTIFAIAITLTSSAFASHYRFDRVDMLTSSEQTALGRLGITDTRRLLSEVRTLSQRVRLARITGLGYERTTDLATQCDLLRIDGIGPSIMRVLQDAGIQDTRALARASATPLLAAMKLASQGTKMRWRLPAETTLNDWIHQATRLPVVLADVPDTEAARRR